MQIESLHIYPIKSCQGLSVQSAALVRRGLEHDRRWMLVDGEGTFISQRAHPQLARLSVSASPTGWIVEAEGDKLEIPQRWDGPRQTARVWASQVAACRHDAASAFFSEYLGESVSLVFMPDDAERPVKRAPDTLVSFADGYPLLLIGTASLDELNQRLSTPVTMNRFRPNIVARTVEPHEEDTWKRVRLGDVSAIHPKRCDRCTMTTVDPSTGVQGKEPLKTLATYRKEEGKVWFGINLIHESPGLLSVGDPVERLE